MKKLKACTKSIKVKAIFSVSAVAFIFAVAVLAYSYFGNIKIPELTVADENGNCIQAIQGGYDWHTGGKYVLADSLSPSDFDYKPENILTIRKESLLTLSNKNNVFDVQDFELISLKDYSKIGTSYGVSQGGFKNGNLIITAPAVSGEYIYSIQLKYRRGTVEYGFKVIVTGAGGADDVSAESTSINP